MEFVELGYIIIVSIGSMVALFILTKLMGYREMSQLSMFDYVTGITIGSIAAEMATSLEGDFLKPLTAMIVYTLIVIAISFINSKSIKIRRVINGTPIILLNDDKLYFENLKRAKIDLAEFLLRCRNSGYFDVSKIQTAILESNGKISFLPKEEERPATPRDFNMKPKQETMTASVIMEGKVLKQNLRHAGKNETWLKNQLKVYGINEVSEVFLATCDNQNKLSVYIKIQEKMKLDIVE